MNLTLISFAAESIEMRIDFGQQTETAAALRPDLHYLPFAVHNPDQSVFGIEFDLTLGPENAETPSPVHLNLRYYAWFQVEGPLPDDLVANDFVMINAPAIAYPYLRAYVSQLTLISGVQPVLLPVVNFVELAKTMRERLAQ